MKMKDEGSRLKAEADDETELDMTACQEACAALSKGQKVIVEWTVLQAGRPIDRREAPESLVKGGQGRTAKEVEENAGGAGIYLAALALGIVLLWMLYIIGVL
jgi:hypothetical protein